MKTILQKTKKITIGILMVSLLFSNQLIAQITQVGTYTSRTTNSTSFSIDKPSGLAVSDVMIASILLTDNDNRSLSDPTRNGWTRIDGRTIYSSGSDEYRGTLLYKVADANDVAASSYSFSLDSDANDGNTGAIIAFRGVDTSGGFDVSGNANSGPFSVTPGTINTSNSSTINADAITTANDNDAVIMFAFAADNNNFYNNDWEISSEPLSLTELYDIDYNTSLDNAISAAWVIKSNAGNTGNGIARMTGNDRNGGILIALKKYCPPPVINTQPIAQTICEGESLNLSVVATDATSYQWKKDGNNIDGATTNSLSISSAIVANAGSYSVDVINSCFTISSDVVDVMIKMVPVAVGMTICQGGEGFLTSTTIVPSETINTGAINPSSGSSLSGPDSNWSNASRITASNNNRTIADIPRFNGISDKLEANQFGFDIPTTATINGISVVIERQEEYGGSGRRIVDNEVVLVSGAITSNDKAKSDLWNDYDEEIIYGGLDDNWGVSWTPEQINDDSFGVQLSAKNTSTAVNHEARVDNITVTVEYNVDGVINWYTSSTGGTPIGSGNSFNPVGVLNSGIPNANTLGTKTFYAEISTSADCRTPVNFTINSNAVCSAIVQASCGVTLDNLNRYVYSTIVRNAQAYRWKVVNQSTFEEQTADTPLRQFRVIMMQNFAYNTQYQVQVAVKVNDVWEEFSAPCYFSTPEPLTQMSDCAATPIAMGTQNSCNIVPFAKGYRFEVSNGVDTQTFDNIIRQFSLSQLTDIEPGTTYDVKVAVQNLEGSFMSYGPTCTITAPGASPTSSAKFAKISSEIVNSVFKVISYPNPFTNDFTINVTSISQEKIQINVFDMTGRLIEDKLGDSNQISSITLGTNYQSGIYNVIVSQGQEVKSLRMIKR